MKKMDCNYFGYLGRPITEACCSKNMLHKDMYDLGALKGYMISYLKQPLNTFRTVSVDDIVTERGFLGDELAMHSASEIRRMGIPLSVNFTSYHKNELITSYLLSSSLCWVSLENKKGNPKVFFATKSYGVLKSLEEHFAKTEKRKKMESFQVQLSTNYSELASGIFEVVMITPDSGGLKLGKAKIKCNDKGTVMTTMYSIGNHIDSVINYLSKHKALITYIDEGTEKNVVTSLVPNILEKWLETRNQKEVERIIDGSSNPFVFGELIVPNLYRKNDFVTIQILSIKSIKKFQ